MSDPDSYSFIKLIDGIQSLSPSREFFVDKTPDELPKAVRVDFEGGRLGLLDMKNPRAVHWADVIDRLGRANRPVYVEIDQETSTIVKLLIPQVYKVNSLTPDASKRSSNPK